VEVIDGDKRSSLLQSGIDGVASLVNSSALTRNGWLIFDKFYCFKFLSNTQQ